MPPFTTTLRRHSQITLLLAPSHSRYTLDFTLLYWGSGHVLNISGRYGARRLTKGYQRASETRQPTNNCWFSMKSTKKRRTFSASTHVVAVLDLFLAWRLSRKEAGRAAELAAEGGVRTLWNTKAVVLFCMQRRLCHDLDATRAEILRVIFGQMCCSSSAGRYL
ncbi:hypothetical protein EJ03DRAFT_12524 [Teratosphaeria nubilosa]|uniref:Uncharacterized protein n=1 Tax=Teratosphaeria nubilosa TaxID=161662 RepID=A0A6G1LHT6_9PEZI|nr:hypothetical protein EJ03DRAFT_12524 [Teratosphaeria nubilosa]